MSHKKYIKFGEKIDYSVLPDRVTLCGIGYLIKYHEDMIIFSQECGFYGTHTELYFHWSAMWQFEFRDTWNRVPAAHVAAALEFLNEKLGQ